MKSLLAIAAMAGFASGFGAGSPPQEKVKLPKRERDFSELSPVEMARVNKLRKESQIKREAKEARRAARMKK